MTDRMEFFIADHDLAAEPFRYSLCGLPNVWLLNGFTRQADDYGDSFDIHDVDGLHQSIAAAIIEQPGILTGPELRFIRKRLRLTQADLGARLRLSDQTVANYEKGQTEVSGPADMMVRVMYLLHELPPDAGRAFVDELLRRISEAQHAHDKNEIVPRARSSWKEHLLEAA
jgi:putative transcriptional regulator